jgi:HAD superfamily hydrolase (TIGR01509 family)
MRDVLSPVFAVPFSSVAFALQNPDNRSVMELSSPGHLRDIQAVIFDMDGLMLDTERVERMTFLRAAGEFGFDTVEEVYVRTIGRNWPDTKRIFADALGSEFPYDQIRSAWRSYTEEHIAEFGVAEKPGLRQLLALLDVRGLPKAVATSTARDKATVLLQRSNLMDCFAVLVCGDEVATGKPAPAIFLEAAKRLKAEPDRCLVFEDSPAGIQAAHAAGMIPVLIPDVVSPTPETIARAFRVYTSLSDAIELF